MLGVRAEILHPSLETVRKVHASGSGPAIALLLAGFAALLLPGCSLTRTAVNLMGNALAGGAGVYASDDDPELIREAIPFGPKTSESVLAVSPEHRRPLFAAASGFTAYAYLVENGADRLDATDRARVRRAGAEESHH